MDIYDNFDADSIEVTVDGDVVKANADITKKEELTISFKNPVEISAKQKVEVIVTTKLNSDFEDYGKTVQLVLKNESDLSANDKNNARVTVDKNTNFVKYIINGGKVKISSTKLGNIEAAINSTDVKLAE
jgi:archaellum component FlaG (FlaF/FlaG flagellin family)